MQPLLELPHRGARLFLLGARVAEQTIKSGTLEAIRRRRSSIPLAVIGGY